VEDFTTTVRRAVWLAALFTNLYCKTIILSPYHFSLSVCLSNSPSALPFTYAPIYPSSLFVYLCISVSLYTFTSYCFSLSVDPIFSPPVSVRPSVRLYISLSVYLCLSVPLVTRISFVWLSVRLSTSLCASGWLTASLYTWVTDRARFNKIYKQFAASAFIMQYRLQFKALICMQIGLSHTYDKQIE
jgi:hypothetical protein